MLKFTGKGSTQTCDGTTRRDFLQVGVLGALGLSLSQMAAFEAMGATAPSSDKKSCIMIFNLGAPSQLDLFDPKPDAPDEIRGPFKAIKTSADYQLTELLPLHAKLADKFSLVRSVNHTAAAVWKQLRTRENLSASFACSGSSSVSWMSFDFVGIALNGPRISAGASGLGSKRSTWLGPPFWNRWMTALALGVKCGFFGLRS